MLRLLKIEEIVFEETQHGVPELDLHSNPMAVG